MKASARTTVCDIVLDSKGGKKNYWCTISKMSASVSSGFPNKRKRKPNDFYFFQVFENPDKSWYIVADM